MFNFGSQSDLRSLQGFRSALERCVAVIEFAPDGTVLTANQKFLDTVGYRLEEIQGKHHSLFVGRDEAADPGYAAFWKALRDGQSRSGEVRRVSKSGKSIWLEAFYSPVVGPGGKVERVVKIACESSARMQEVAHNASLINAINQTQAVIEFTVDGIVRKANANFLTTMGYEEKEIIGQHHRMFMMPAESESQAYRSFWEDLRAGRSREGEFMRVANGGRHVWLRASYNPILDGDGVVRGVVKFAVDITSRKLAAAENAAKLAALDKSQAVIEFNLDGTIITANANFLAVLGYTLEEIRGKHHSLFMPAEERNAAGYKAFWDDLRAGKPQSGQFHRIGKGGRDVWIEASYNPVMDVCSNKPAKVVKFATDVTKRVLEAEHDRRVSEMLRDVAVGTTQLSQSVGEIASGMENSTKTAAEAVGLASSADVASHRLVEAAEAMGGIVDVIKDITSQINLLALNATIESARAGEAGKGFAVVAGEVKNLAQQARNATERISGEIENMRGISGEVGDALSTIRSAIEKVQGFVGATAVAVEQQSSVTGRMSQAAREIMTV
ncbi:methyl-accepting chemotaxis protein [Radicibacter daui]|uniref:methyl-accepting chemotaxis protein n=1 Tax=Radicibacter daui TaxID=3064829 RepID=UPI004046C644